MKIEVRNATQLLLVRAECKAVRNRKCKGLDNPAAFHLTSGYILLRPRAVLISTRETSNSLASLRDSSLHGSSVVPIYNERYGRIRGECIGTIGSWHCIIALSSSLALQSGNSAPTSRDTGIIYPATLPHCNYPRRKCQGPLMHEVPLLHDMP